MIAGGNNEIEIHIDRKQTGYDSDIDSSFSKTCVYYTRLCNWLLPAQHIALEVPWGWRRTRWRSITLCGGQTSCLLWTDRSYSKSAVASLALWPQGQLRILPVNGTARASSSLHCERTEVWWCGVALWLIQLWFLWWVHSWFPLGPAAEAAPVVRCQIIFEMSRRCVPTPVPSLPSPRER